MIPSLAHQGRGVLLASHLLREIEQICDRVAIVRRGKLLAFGRVDDLRRRGSTSVFKGVSYDRRRRPSRAYTGLNSEQMHLGRYETKEQAAKAYNADALKYFGEFARLNRIA